MNMQRTSALLFLIIILLSGCKKDNDPKSPPPSQQPDSQIGFFTGMDLSYQSFLESYDVQYYDEAGNPISGLLTYFADNGVDLIRVRLFHSPLPVDPVAYSSNLDYVKELCRKIDEAGSKILLDIHYSDTWADPGKQEAPAAWQGLGFDRVIDSIYGYTLAVLEELHEQNTLPYIVQIGNETNPGFVWEYGRIGQNMENLAGFVDLANSAHMAVDDMKIVSGDSIYSMIHFAGLSGSDWYFHQVIKAGLQFDLIGISYYHLWHKRDLDYVALKLNTLAAETGKPVMIVETFYPWTLGWNDWTFNWVGEEEQLIPGYPATPEGQAKYFTDLVSTVKNIPGGYGLGIIWWAPDLLAFNGPESAEGSFMENLAIFDFDNRLLPAIEVFRDN